MFSLSNKVSSKLEKQSTDTRPNYPQYTCTCKDEHFPNKRAMGKNNYSAKWDPNDDPWCYTKHNCGEQGQSGSYKYCKKSLKSLAKFILLYLNLLSYRKWIT